MHEIEPGSVVFPNVLARDAAKTLFPKEKPKPRNAVPPIYQLFRVQIELLS
ncbi:MAG: hypothetical protein ACKVT2_18380 [Saprospiraceae bacterium]